MLPELLALLLVVVVAAAWMYKARGGHLTANEKPGIRTEEKKTQQQDACAATKKEEAPKKVVEREAEDREGKGGRRGQKAANVCAI